jgi:hypothetical protein
VGARCPNCGHFNYSTQIVCGCGYDFVSGQMKPPRPQSDIDAEAAQAIRDAEMHRVTHPKTPLDVIWLAEISDLHTARRVARHGVWAAGLVAVPMAIFAVPQNPFQIVDLFLYLILAVGIWRLWRSAAVAGLVLELVEALNIAMRHSSTTGMWIRELVVLALFWNGIRGTFAYHRLARDAAAQSSGGRIVST